MAMVKDIFKARADSFGETMIGGSGTVSFKLPEYQRPYDWDKNNVLRLLHDCLNGLKGAASGSQSHPYTFLGTIILTSDEAREPTFDGNSLSIVDGQQRLTTLLLLSCALFSAIRSHMGDTASVSHSGGRTWLQGEAEEQSNRLYGCTTGRKQSLYTTSPFPRMVRVEDKRGHLDGQSQYQSAIAVFLNQFGQYCRDQSSAFLPELSNADDHLLVMYRYIRQQIEQSVYLGQPASEDQDDEFDPPVLSQSELASQGCLGLFAKLNGIAKPSNEDPQPDPNELVGYAAGNPETEGLTRLLLFASYLMKSVVLTVVEAPSEEVAFDIFDALNTTGEPLTALETLKPHIVRFEHRHGNGYFGSESENWWKVLEENVLEPYDTPAQRQRETKELVTGFALYYLGEKLGSELKDQRNTLRAYFTQAEQQGPVVARKLLAELGRIAQFRRQYWDKDAIAGLVGQQTESEDYDTLKLCLRFIADTNTSTVIPILARYLIEFDETDPDQHFLRVVKAVTAFLVLRRALTGGTSGIDSDFRRVMSTGVGPHSNSLCLGSGLSKQILSIDELKNGLRALLAASRFHVTDKSTWINRAREVAQGAEGSRVVCRFLLFAASHNARADVENPGLAKTEEVISSDEIKFLSYTTWTGHRYRSVEHVAPASEASNGWDPKIYGRFATRHEMGNLVLLPERENQSIGNAPWDKKKLFYRALAAKTKPEREQAITLAQQQQLKFGSRTLNLIRNQDRLHMLDPIAAVEDWTTELIEARTENVLGLAWDQIAPWLYN